MSDHGSSSEINYQIAEGRTRSGRGASGRCRIRSNYSRSVTHPPPKVRRKNSQNISATHLTAGMTLGTSVYYTRSRQA